MLLSEIWKDIIGYEGKYQISNYGRVCSLNYHKTGKPSIMKPRIGTRGYFQIGLWKDSKYKRLYIHRLVAEAFCENPDKENYTQVNHKDENKLNNNAANLEWCTPKYNINYGDHNKKVAERNSKSVICEETGMYYSSIKEASSKTGISISSISYVCTGKRAKTRGFSFRFREEVE